MYFNSELVIINDVFLPKRCVLNQANSKIIIINFISILLASCSVTKQLNQEERLISKQTYELNGKKIVSKLYFEVISKRNNFSYLEIDLITGRKHQIRKQIFFIRGFNSVHQT